MKKAISILLVVAIAASLCMTAFAADTATHYCSECKRNREHYYTTSSWEGWEQCSIHEEEHDYYVWYTYGHYECLKCGNMDNVVETFNFDCPYGR